MSYALVIDDEQPILDLMTTMLESLGWVVVSTTSGAKAIEQVRNQVPAFVITDVVMPDMEGIEFVRQLGRLLPQTPVIVMSGNPVGMQFLESARLFGAKATLSKPFSKGQLEAAVQSVTGETQQP